MTGERAPNRETPAWILTEGGNPVLSYPSAGKPVPFTRQPGNPPRRHSHRRWESSPVFVAAFLPSFSPAGGNPECGLGLDSRGGHENDGGERPMAIPAVSFPSVILGASPGIQALLLSRLFFRRHSRALPGNPVLHCEHQPRFPPSARMTEGEANGHSRVCLSFSVILGASPGIQVFRGKHQPGFPSRARE